MDPDAAAEAIIDGLRGCSPLEGPARMRAFMEGIAHCDTEKLSAIMASIESLESEMSVADLAALYVRAATPKTLAAQLNANPDPEMAAAVREAYRSYPELLQRFDSAE